MASYLYCVSSENTRKYNQRKLGLTICPHSRLRTYNTGDAPIPGNQKSYEGIWKVQGDLRNLEKILHSHFHYARQKGPTGNYTEWFEISLEEVADFLNNQIWTICQLSLKEIQEIHKKSEESDASDATQETLKNKFFHIFLAGKTPRRIQLELWDIMEAKCSSPDALNYKGIVQWPTGTGKSIGMLILIVLEAERCKRLGLIYRGMLISHKNDIFDTIKTNFSKLSEFGIKLYDGTHGQFSKMNIAASEPLLIMACHSAFINKDVVDSLPPIAHIHYDEVHRITGEEFFQLLKQKMEEWKTELLTGTSATPKTSSPSQHKKMAELFGDPINILHKCDIYEAVQEGWIARPRFIVKILQKQAKHERAAVIEAFVDSVISLVKQKGKGGKNIFYIETSMEDVRYAYNYARIHYPAMNFYAAIDGDRTDDQFLKADVSSTAEIMFACQRYREGSDIRGLEITGKLVGNQTSAYILLQICGRALRIEGDSEKEGWCIIARPSEEGTTEEDVLDSIVLEIAEFLGNSEKILEKKEIVELVKTYFEEITISGSKCSLEETIDRIQAAYLRNQYAKRTPKEKYALIRAHNKEMGLRSKNEYIERAGEHPKYIEDPKKYFEGWWISWYHFLNIDTSTFPETKSEWINICKDMRIATWDEYKSKKISTLPANPGEMYENYTNWSKEFGLEEEIVW